MQAEEICRFFSRRGQTFENFWVTKRVFGGDVFIGRSRLTAERFSRASVNIILYISQYRASIPSPSETRSFVWCEIFSVWYHFLVSFVCDLYCVCGALHAEFYVIYAYLVWRFALISNYWVECSAWATDRPDSLWILREGTRRNSSRRSVLLLKVEHVKFTLG